MRLKNLADLSGPPFFPEICDFASLFKEWERILQYSHEYLAKDLDIEEWHFLSIENVHEYDLRQCRCEGFRTYVCQQSKAVRGFLALASFAPNEVERFFYGKEDWVISRNFQLFVYAVLAVREQRFNAGQLIRLCETYAAPLEKYIFPVAMKNLNKHDVVKWLVENFHRCPEEHEQAFRKEVVRYFGAIDKSSVQGVLYRLCAKSASEVKSSVTYLALSGLVFMAFIPPQLPAEWYHVVFVTLYFGMWFLFRKMLSD